jgi:formate hydrogenlyase transcriptional activator
MASALQSITQFERTPPSRLSASFLQEGLGKEETGVRDVLSSIVGCQGGLRHILAQVKVVAPTNATVLIVGETGTGKELIVQAIHELSSRRAHKIVKLNCAAMPAGLLESELFGHERGAFTGAVNSYAGRFSIADRGTLFLDEIGDMPLELQPKLLRVLQEREFEPVGSSRTLKVNVRIVAATNRDLAQMVADRAFRQDLFYRLNVFPLSLPPLRERKGDIPHLVGYFVNQYAGEIGKIIREVSDRSMQSMLSHPWPGNVRELQNFVARGVILARTTIFDFCPPQIVPKTESESCGDSLQDKIRREVLAACRKTNWQIAGPRGAAALLGLKRTTLVYKMRRLGIAPPDRFS